MQQRQAQQETFDEIVREGMEEFGLSAEEAVSEAKEQLSMSGITDFSNLDLTSHLYSSPSEKGRDAETLTNGLRSALADDNGSVGFSDAITKFFETVNDSSHLCSHVGSLGAIELVAGALVRSEQSAKHVVLPCCKLLYLLCVNDNANRARFENLQSLDAVTSLKQCIERGCSPSWEETWGDRDLNTLSALQAISAVQRKSERMKKRIANGETLQHLLYILRDTGKRVLTTEDNDNADSMLAVYKMACVVVRQLVTPDDPRVDVSEAFARARVLGGGSNVTDSGLKPLSNDFTVIDFLAKVAHMTMESKEGSITPESRKSLLFESLSTVRCCAIADEICKSIIDHGLIGVSAGCVRDYQKSEDMLLVALKLARNVAARDDGKTTVFERLGVFTEMVTTRVSSSDRISEAYAALIAQVTLRRPEIARELAISGTPQTLLIVMQAHADCLSVQKASCTAIRNICSRDDVARQHVRDCPGAEQTIRKVWSHFGGSCDEAYYALREMDVLADSELRRDTRYKMPPEFFKS